VIAWRRIGVEIEVVGADGLQAETLAETRRTLGRPLHAVVLEPASSSSALARFMHSDDHAARLMDDMEQDLDLQQLTQDLPVIVIC